jgi:hypothetical protein
MRFPDSKTFLIASLSAAGLADASCGLHICPRRDPDTHAWQLGWTQSQSGFDLAHTTGTFAEGVAQIRYQHGQSFMASAHIPFLALTIGSHTAFGPGNPLALIEYRIHPGAGTMLGVGMQAEIPLGDHGSGLAQEHFMAMPYATLSKSLADFFFSGSSGISKAIGPHEHGAGTGTDVMEGMEGMDHASHAAHQGIGSPLYVHPHEDFEWSWRTSTGVALLRGRINPEVSLSGQHVLSEPAEAGAATYFLSAGISAPIRMGRYEVTPEAGLPVSPDHRFEWTAGLGFGIRI